jgi:hypothetical protein
VKGYAFVEFDKPESAGNALKALVAEKSRLRPDMDPAELQSVKTFISEQEMEKESSQKVPKEINIYYLVYFLKKKLFICVRKLF